MNYKNCFSCLLFILLVSISLFSQNEAGKYQRILITGNIPEIRKQMALMGFETEHGHWSNQKAIVEISQKECQQLNQAGITFSVLIDDLSEYYARRAEQDMKKSTTDKIKFYPNCQSFSTLKKPQWFHLGTMGGFYTLQQMIYILDSMKLLYPNLITSKQPVSSTLTLEGRPIYYIKISDNPNVDENEPEVLYTSLHHAREPLSLSQLIFSMWYILENYNSDPDIKYLVDNAELFFIPCVNPDGYEYNYSTNPNGGGMFRKNKRLNPDNSYGVDLNRNYGYQWGFDNFGSSPTYSAQTYRGSGPFSEPETQIIRSFCLNRQFVNALNAHSYSNLMIYPWGYQPSFYTPDSIWFKLTSDYMCKENRYTYGTADQTVQYLVNGSSDDWMYGEQTQKGKTMAMTPESGSVLDGFWPSPSNILELCRSNFFSNLRFGLSALRYSRVEDESDHFISGSGFIKYSIRRLGLDGNGQFTLSVVPLQGIASVGPSKTYSLALNQSVTDSISFIPNSLLQPGQKILYILRTYNGIYNHDDTIQKIFGTPVIAFQENFNTNLSQWQNNGWGLENAQFVSPPSCVSDSPGGLYMNNQLKPLITSVPVDLTNATHAHLQYFIKYSTEKTFDLLYVIISTNNGQTWNTLCGKYSSFPPHVQGSDPAYEGKQRYWVKEEIDITPYAGNQVKIGFVFSSDNYGTDDGFYLDDILVRKVVNPNGASSLQHANPEVFLYPSYGDGTFHILKNTSGLLFMEIYSSDGKRIHQETISTGTSYQDFHLPDTMSDGLYFIRICSSHSQNQKIFKYILKKGS